MEDWTLVIISGLGDLDSDVFEAYYICEFLLPGAKSTCPPPWTAGSFLKIPAVRKE